MEATRRKRAEPHEHTRMQVRLDLPTPISYAPDQTEMHNALRRLFVVPAKPEPLSSLYDFAHEIAERDGLVSAPSSAFVIGDDDGLTPAQLLAQQVRDRTGGANVTDSHAQHESATPRSEAGDTEDLKTRKSASSVVDSAEDEAVVPTDDVKPNQAAVNDMTNDKETSEQMPTNDAKPTAGELSNDMEASEQMASDALEDKGDLANKETFEHMSTEKERIEGTTSQEEDAKEIQSKPLSKSQMKKAKTKAKKQAQNMATKAQSLNTKPSKESPRPGSNSDASGEAESENARKQDCQEDKDKDVVVDAKETEKAEEPPLPTTESETAEECALEEPAPFETDAKDKGNVQDVQAGSAQVTDSSMLDDSLATGIAEVHLSDDNRSMTKPPENAEKYAASLCTARTSSTLQTNAMHELSRHGNRALPFEVRKNLLATNFQPPPSSSDTKYATHRWDTPTWSSLRSAEMLNGAPKGRDAGTQWLAISGSGESTCESAAESEPGSLATIAALFVPDPRPWRPYRLVRRSNPRQLLLLTAGAELSSQQIKSMTLAQQVASGVAKPPKDARSLASYFGTTENATSQAGLGFVYSPSAALCSELGEPADVRRAETNFSRRLERPVFPNRTSRSRAALRSVIAALEYVHWEEEGFDKIVVATHHAWIVQGISNEYVAAKSLTQYLGVAPKGLAPYAVKSTRRPRRRCTQP